jgi:pimeloyl-ACP methyl ester carboxylesterase
MREVQVIEKSIKIDQNHTLAYRLCGESSKVRFVFLHGLGGCAGAFKEMQLLLYTKHHYSSIAIDLPGHGFSSNPRRNNFTPHAMAQHIQEALSQLNFKQKPVLVGHCLGGMVATQLAAIDQSAFSGLVLINTIVKTPFYMRVVNPFDVFSRFLTVLSSIGSGKRPHSRKNYSRFKNTGDFSLRRVIDDIKHTSFRNHLRAFAPVFAYDASKLAKKLTIPIKILAGMSDKLFFPFVAKQMAEMLPVARLTWIKKGNHVMVLVKHKEIVAELIQFHHKLSKQNA